MRILRTTVLLTFLIESNAYSNGLILQREHPYVIDEMSPLVDNGVQVAKKKREITSTAVDSKCMDYQIDSGHENSGECVRRNSNVAINEYKKEGGIDAAKSVEYADQNTTLAQNDKFGAVMEMLDDSAENATGEEAEFYKISRDWLHEAELANDQWAASYDAVQAPRILDYAVLTSDEEFEYQKGVVKKYIDESIAGKVRSDNMLLNYKKRLSVLGEDNDFARGAIKGATERWAARQKVLDPLNQAHIRYGNDILHVLELLQAHQDDWTYEDDQLLFSNDDTLSRYNALYHSINGNAAIINTLSRVAYPDM